MTPSADRIVVPLRDVARVYSGGTPARANPAYWGGDVPWVTTAEIDQRYIRSSREAITELGLSASAAKIAPPGTLLLAMYGQGKTRGKVAMLELAASMNQACAAIAVGSRVDAHYLFHYLDSRYVDIRAMSNSGSQDNLSGELVGSIPVVVPSIGEQRAIAGALDDADELTCSLERLIAKKRDIKQGMIQELLTGRIRIGSGAGAWPTVRLLDLVTIASGQVDPRRPEFRDLPLIAPDHIESGTGRLLAVKTAAEQGAISGKYLAEPGDVIYSKIRPYLRKAHVARFRTLCSADMYPLRPKSGVDPEFVLNTLLGARFTDFATSASMRSGIPKINRVELAAFELAAPPSEEQQKIAEVLLDADAEIRAIENRLRSARAIKTGMMQELLTGGTRLPMEAVS